MASRPVSPVLPGKLSRNAGPRPHPRPIWDLNVKVSMWVYVYFL